MIVVMFLLGMPALSGAVEVNIVGEVNDSYQIVGDDGKIYEVAESDAGDELITQHIGSKVVVSGTLSKVDDDEMEIILVKHFKVLDDEVKDYQEVDDNKMER